MSTNAEVKPKLGYEEYACFPDNGMRHEIVNGVHYMNPAPNPRHQLVSRRIQFQLYTQIELAGLGQVIDAPIDVQLSDHDIVQPDLVVVLRERENIITATRLQGTPDLLIEILSATTANYDRTLKKQLYLQSKVPEYWIVDPNQQVIEQFVLREAEYESIRQRLDRIVLYILPDVSVNLSEVW